MLEYNANDITLVVGNQLSSISELTGIAGNVYGIAQLSGVATSPFLSDKNKYPYYSRISASSTDQVSAIIATLKYYSSSGLGWEKVSIISTAEAYGINLSSAFIDEAAEEGITVASYEQFIIGTTDIDVELQEIQKSGARVILALIFTQWEFLITKANEYGLVGESYVWIVPNAIVGIIEEVQNVKELTRGVLGSQVYVPQNTPEFAQFIATWFSLDPVAFPGSGVPPSPFALFGYDMMRTATIAIEKLYDENILFSTPRISPEIWTNTIRNISFNGVTGFVEFNELGDRISPFSISYYRPETNSWVQAAFWSPQDDSYTQLADVVWYSNTTEIPDLDIRPPFHYWSCHNKEKRYDETGKTIQLHSPDGSDIDDIDIDYQCDNFIDCKNISDESSDCTSNYVVVFIVFGIITIFLIFVALLILLFIILFGVILKYKRLRVISPNFMVLMCITLMVGFISVFSWYGKPHPVACGFQPWLLGLSVTSLLSTLVAKNFRIWRIFKYPLKRTRITDLELFLLYALLMFPVLLILTLWTIISTPTASLEHRDGEDHYICNTGGFTGEPGGIVFFFILVGYSSIILFLGVLVSIATRKVPAVFNEAPLIAISIYNLGFLSVVIIPVFFVVQPFNPFIAWILRTIAILYAFTATMVLQFFPKIFLVVVVDKLRNTRNLEVTTMTSSMG